MTLVNDLVETAVLSLRDPRAGAARVLRWSIPDNALWPLVALSVVLSTLAAEFNSALNLPQPGQQALYIPPLVMAVMLGAINVTMAAAVASVGRAVGGKGGFRPALVLLTWQQFLWFGVLTALSLLGLVIPVLGILAAFALGLFMIWVLIAFVSVLHDITLGMAVLVVFISSIGAVFLMIFFLGVFGVTLTGTGVQ